jgi:hypothetical protein
MKCNKNEKISMSKESKTKQNMAFNIAFKFKHSILCGLAKSNKNFRAKIINHSSRKIGDIAHWKNREKTCLNV